MKEFEKPDEGTEPSGICMACGEYVFNGAYVCSKECYEEISLDYKRWRYIPTKK